MRHSGELTDHMAVCAALRIQWRIGGDDEADIPREEERSGRGVSMAGCATGG